MNIACSPNTSETVLKRFSVVYMSFCRKLSGYYSDQSWWKKRAVGIEREKPLNPTIVKLLLLSFYDNDDDYHNSASHNDDDDSCNIPTTETVSSSCFGNIVNFEYTV